MEVEEEVEVLTEARGVSGSDLGSLSSRTFWWRLITNVVLLVFYDTNT